MKRPISTGTVLYRCGMHLLGAPDVEVEAGPLDEAIALIDSLAGYLLTEERARQIGDGEGFRLDRDAPRWIFNPYGYWRLTRS